MKQLLKCLAMATGSRAFGDIRGTELTAIKPPLVWGARTHLRVTRSIRSPSHLTSTWFSHAPACRRREAHAACQTIDDSDRSSIGLPEASGVRSRNLHTAAGYARCHQPASRRPVQRVGSPRVVSATALLAAKIRSQSPPRANLQLQPTARKPAPMLDPGS